MYKHFCYFILTVPQHGLTAAREAVGLALKCMREALTAEPSVELMQVEAHDPTSCSCFTDECVGRGRLREAMPTLRAYSKETYTSTNDQYIKHLKYGYDSR